MTDSYLMQANLNNILPVKAMVDPVGQYSRPDMFCLHINKNSNPHTVVTGEPSLDSKIDDVIQAFLILWYTELIIMFISVVL